jgi:D-sedoheptulose 7-phosphate isomerase
MYWVEARKSRQTPSLWEYFKFPNGFQFLEFHRLFLSLRQYKDMTDTEVWKSALTEANDVLTAFLKDPSQIEKCESFTQRLTSTFEKGGKLFTCGNGGSHCDAMHFAEEFTGRYRKERKPLGALALGDQSHTTCVANDYGFDFVFSRQLEGLGRAGDLLVGLSTSGNSKNIIVAFEAAKKMGIQTVALLGRDGGKLKSMADLAIVIPAQTSDRIQEMHIKIIHTVIETVERRLFPDNYL